MPAKPHVLALPLVLLALLGISVSLVFGCGGGMESFGTSDQAANGRPGGDDDDYGYGCDYGYGYGCYGYGR